VPQGDLLGKEGDLIWLRGYSKAPGRAKSGDHRHPRIWAIPPQWDRALSVSGGTAGRVIGIGAGMFRIEKTVGSARVA
jgi:hypothetical protein